MNTEQCGSTPNTTTTDFTNRGRRGYADLMDTARWPYCYSVKTITTDYIERGYADLMDTARCPYFHSVKTTQLTTVHREGLC